jgi:plastocyanin
MRRIGRHTVVVLLMIATSFVLGLPVAPANGGSGVTWTVAVGGADKDSSVVSSGFFPHTLTVTVGDTVHWVFDGQWLVHTVTFLSGSVPPLPDVEQGGKSYLNPRVVFPAGGQTYDGAGYHNSGLPPDPTKPFSYTLTFTKPGTFTYLCLLHPGQEGQVVVKDRAGETPTQATARGKQELAAALRAGDRAYRQWGPMVNGRTVTIRMIGDLGAHWSVLRFTPTPLVVPRGTTVIWDMRDSQEIHAVTFPGGQGSATNFILPQPQPDGPPKLLENPQVVVRNPATEYKGVGLASSGILLPPGTPGNRPTSYRLTFTQPGRFAYVCAIHAPQGMWGTVIVK